MRRVVIEVWLRTDKNISNFLFKQEKGSYMCIRLQPSTLAYAILLSFWVLSSSNLSGIELYINVACGKAVN